MNQFYNAFTKLLLNAKTLALPREFFKKIVMNAIASKRAAIVSYNDSERGKIFDLINKIKEETDMLMVNYEAYQIFMAAKRTEKIQGDMAEVGTYK